MPRSRSNAEIIVGAQSRSAMYRMVRQLRETTSTPVTLVVVADLSAGLSVDFARIRWCSHVYRDLGCVVTYSVPATHPDIDAAMIGGLAAGAAAVELQQVVERESEVLLRRTDDLIRSYAPVSSPRAFFPPAPDAAVARALSGSREGAQSTLRVGALITARTASARLPRKALADIAGVESIALLIERLKGCRTCSEIVLCTTTAADDDQLAAVGAREGIRVFRGPGENVALRLLGAVREYGLDHFVRITGDDPLRCVDLIDTAVESHLATGADYTAMSGVFEGGDSEIISADALRAIVERAVRSDNTEYLTWYLDDPTVFRVNRIDAGPRYWRDYRLTLDTREDLAVMRAIHEALYAPGRPVDAVAALEWLDHHPEIALSNRSVGPKVRRDDLNLDLYL